MYIDQAITSVPKKKKHVVAGQIHDSEDDVIVIRLEYPKLFVDINGKNGPVLDSNYTLGKRFTVKFVAENGKINVFYNGSKDPVYSLSKKGSGYYFKAGAYTQSNCSKESVCDGGNYGEVVIYDLAVKHGKSSSELSVPEASVAAQVQEAVAPEEQVAQAEEASSVEPVSELAQSSSQDYSIQAPVVAAVEKKSIMTRFFQFITYPLRDIFQKFSKVGSLLEQLG